MDACLSIAWRFAVSRKRSMAMSLLGVTLGVGFFVLTQAQTGGFKEFFVATILGTNGAVQVTDRFQAPMTSMTLDLDALATATPAKTDSAAPPTRIRQRQGASYEEGVAYPAALREALLSFEQVTGVSETLEDRATIESGFRSQTARLFGIRLEDHRRVSSIEEQVVLGNLADFARDPLSVMISPRMAERLRVELGDTVQIRSGADSRNYRVAALVESGVSAIDKVRIYMDLAEVRSLTGTAFGQATLQLSLADPDQADWVALQIEESLRHIAASWQEREQVWLDVFRALGVSAGISMSAIIVLAGLGIYNALSMQVVEKQREIAILRAMGFTRWDMMRVFLYQGMLVAAVGVLAGWALGGLATWGVTQIPLRIRGIFSSDHFVVSWELNDYIWGAVIALVVAGAGSVFPAMRGSRIEPGEVIRGN